MLFGVGWIQVFIPRPDPAEPHLLFDESGRCRSRCRENGLHAIENLPDSFLNRHSSRLPSPDGFKFGASAAPGIYPATNESLIVVACIENIGMRATRLHTNSAYDL